MLLEGCQEKPKVKISCQKFTPSKLMLKRGFQEILYFSFPQSVEKFYTLGKGWVWVTGSGFKGMSSLRREGVMEQGVAGGVRIGG